MFNNIREFFEQPHLLCPNSAVSATASAVNHCVCLVHDVPEALKSKTQVDGIFLDLGKLLTG